MISARTAVATVSTSSHVDYWHKFNYREGYQMKTCTKCGTSKPITEFGKRANARDGLSSWCKGCKNAQVATWAKANADRRKDTNAAHYATNRDRYSAIRAGYYQANKERMASSGAAWHAANPESLRIRSQNRRARKREVGGKLSSGLAERLFKLQRGKCACGCKQPLGDDFHLDHIMPLALGGTNTDDNIQLLRATCNMKKNAKHPVDFMRERGLLL